MLFNPLAHFRRFGDSYVVKRKELVLKTVMEYFKQFRLINIFVLYYFAVVYKAPIPQTSIKISHYNMAIHTIHSNCLFSNESLFYTYGGQSQFPFSSWIPCSPSAHSQGGGVVGGGVVPDVVGAGVVPVYGVVFSVGGVVASVVPVTVVRSVVATVVAVPVVRSVVATVVAVPVVNSVVAAVVAVPVVNSVVAAVVAVPVVSFVVAAVVFSVVVGGGVVGHPQAG